ncbi:TonB-dependent receptor [Sphingomonas swuensis]|uniref:TonB-dependent receptor n=1 Tax=Sphingomonas swuensis TaxID=977800 RepID=A0ABP7SGW9_9SPHN
MTSSTSLRRLALAASPFALGLALIASPAAAQTTQPADAETKPATTEDEGNEAATPAPTEDEAIIVTGFRRSLESAVRTKKNQEQIVESVTAEDIGKLPDNSIGESIARLPGIASQRTSGRANVIAIRGFGPDFSQTLLNGREQTSTNDNRGVEFDQYPSEVVSQVVVYKSPSASLVGQGLVGTVDIRTVRPLDVAKRTIAIGLRGSYADLGKLNSGSKDTGYRASATFIDRFYDDRVGISLAASYVDEPYQNQEFNAWGYAGVNVNGQNANLIGGSKSFVTSTQLKRFGLNGTFQAELASNLILTVDGFYSKFKDDQTKRGIELPLGFGAFGTTFNTGTFQVEDGTVVSGTFNNVQGVVRNDIFAKKADLFSGGINLAWNNDNGWKAFGDASYSRTDREELSIESYSGTGFGEGLGATDTISFVTGTTGTKFKPTLNYGDPNLIRLTDPLGWGGSATTPQAGYYNNRILDDELVQVRGEVQKEIGSFLDAVKVGINYTDRTKSLTPDEYLVRLRGGALELPIPASALLKPTNLSYLGLGPVVSYDPRDLIADGTLVLAPNTSNDIPAKAYNVFEKVWTGYVQANLKGNIGAAELTGNVGVQVIHTDQKSTGIAFLNGNRVDVSAGDKYWMVLPSANLNARLPNDIVVRFAAAREIQRPRLDQMRSAIGYGINTTDRPQPFISGSGGNPTLRPYQANAVDFNVEKYFGGQGYVALQLFWKDITKYIDNGRIEDFDYSGFPLPVGVTPPSLIGRLDAPVNTKGGKMYGAEVAATLPFSVFTSALDGFGLTGGVGYTKTKVRDFNGNVTQIPGYSKWVANGTAFFEKWGFNARASARYRSTFLGDFTGFGGSPTRRIALDETIFDAQVGYDFNQDSMFRGLSVYLQGQNLTDERFASVNGNENPRQVVDYQIYGRRFLAGLTYKF